MFSAKFLLLYLFNEVTENFRGWSFRLWSRTFPRQAAQSVGKAKA